MLPTPSLLFQWVCFLVVRPVTAQCISQGQDGSERVLPDVVKHPAWTNLEFWEGVLVESLAVAQAEANETEKKSLRKQFIDADNSEANAQRELEERVAYGQMCWLLQQMTLFGVSAEACRVCRPVKHCYCAGHFPRMLVL